MKDTNLPHMIDVRGLTPYESNARTHSAEQIEQIKASIRRFGFVGVLGYDNRGLAIGHGRRTALLEMWDAAEDVMGPGKRKLLPIGKAPAIDISGLDDAERRALIIADNQLALNANWDDAMLSAELAALAAMDFDMPIIGFDTTELDRLMNPPAEGTGSSLGSMAAEFLIPPFSVLSAREGWWQDRKRQWIALGIQSEVGRGENLLKMSDTMLEPDPVKRAANGKRKAAEFGQDLMRGEHTNAELGHPGRKADAIPGGGGTNRRARGQGTMMPYNADGQPRSKDAKSTNTQDLVTRKIADGDIEGGMAAGQTGTSIFDPVLCELVYRWFSPQGGLVLDPFAGGSVRGIVAAALGRRYVGVDLRSEQIEANRAQWPAVAARLGPAAPSTEVPTLQVDTIDGFRVVRDDMVMGGTKRRALDRMMAASESDHFVYATPAYGFAQIALAYAARAAGKKATIFVAGRKLMHPRTALALEAGANIIEIEKGGYLTVVQARAKAFAAAEGAELMPFGLESEAFIDAIADEARYLGERRSYAMIGVERSNRPKTSRLR